jgi:hypothetical protein
MEEFLTQYWPLLIPIVVIELGLKIFALLDLLPREQVTGGKKWVWAIVILAVNLLGSIIYLVFGRKE